MAGSVRLWGLGLLGAMIAFTALPLPAVEAAASETIYGHRGYVGQVEGRLQADENTIQSCLNARAAGALGCEFDTRITRDGGFLLMHDASLDRTTNCSGALRTKTYAGISRFCRTQRGWRVPTLNQFLKAVLSYAPATSFQHEIKDNLGEAELQRILDIYSRHNLLSSAFLTSRRLSVLQSLERLAPGVRKGWIANPGSPFGGTELAGAGAVVDEVVVFVTDASPEYVSSLRRNGYDVQIWGVTTRAQYATLRENGAQGVITRRIKRLVASG